jgi:hypothetical protein
LVLIENLVDWVKGIRKIEEWETNSIVTRDTKTRVTTKGLLYPFDVERVAYTLVATCFGITSCKIWMYIALSGSGKEIKEGNV